MFSIVTVVDTATVAEFLLLLQFGIMLIRVLYDIESPYIVYVTGESWCWYWWPCFCGDMELLLLPEMLKGDFASFYHRGCCRCCNISQTSYSFMSFVSSCCFYVLLVWHGWFWRWPTSLWVGAVPRSMRIYNTEFLSWSYPEVVDVVAVAVLSRSSGCCGCCCFIQK